MKTDPILVSLVAAGLGLGAWGLKTEFDMAQDISVVETKLTDFSSSSASHNIQVDNRLTAIEGALNDHSSSIAAIQQNLKDDPRAESPPIVIERRRIVPVPQPGLSAPPLLRDLFRIPSSLLRRARRHAHGRIP